MIIRDNGDVESESDSFDCEGMPPLEVVMGMSWHYRLRSPWLKGEHFRFRSKKMILMNKGRTSSIRVVTYKERCVV